MSDIKNDSKKEVKEAKEKKKPITWEEKKAQLKREEEEYRESHKEELEKMREEYLKHPLIDPAMTKQLEETLKKIRLKEIMKKSASESPEFRKTVENIKKRKKNNV